MAISPRGKSVKVAGDVFTTDLTMSMRTQHNFYVGESTAEKIKKTIGSANEELDNPPDDLLIQGRDLLSGKPKQIEVSYRDIAKALEKSIIRIEDAVMETLSKTPRRFRSNSNEFLSEIRSLPICNRRLANSNNFNGTFLAANSSGVRFGFSGRPNLLR